MKKIAKKATKKTTRVAGKKADAIKVEKGIPMPTKKDFQARASKYPFRTMAKGDSFALPYIKKIVSAVAAAATRAKRLGVGTFKVKKMGSTLRCWRIA